MMTNSNKLKGKIVENGYTLSSFSDAIPLSRMSLRRKLNGEADFRVSEIEKICSLLGIERSEISNYFFTS